MRVFNFNPGPATLPLPVLTKIQAELLDYQHCGMSILEMSHRSPEVEQVLTETEQTILTLLGLEANYRVLFLQGGASLQFTMLPMNLLPAGRTADYLITGIFADKAYKDAKLLGQVHMAATGKADNFRRIPSREELNFSDNPVYIHLTSNNTIYGTQWQSFPDTGSIPLVADMSSDILSRRINAEQFALIYAGAQKNLGPAGVTVVIIRSDLLNQIPANLPSMLSYQVQSSQNSMYNTPPVFSIYVVHQVLNWIKANGGLAAMEQLNKSKADLVYAAIDTSGGFYHGHAEPASRSMMNITFRLPSPELEEEFVAAAAQLGLPGLAGHRSVGGIRASIYNAMPLEGCQALSNFMRDFCARKG